MYKYNVFGNLDEMCNSNILGNLKTVNAPPLTDAKSEDDFNLEDVLNSSNDISTSSKKRSNTNILKSTPPSTLLPAKRPSARKASSPKRPPARKASSPKRPPARKASSPKRPPARKPSSPKRPPARKPSSPKRVEVLQAVSEETCIGRRTRSSLTRNSKKQADPISAPVVTKAAPKKGARKGRGRAKQVKTTQTSNPASSEIPVTNSCETIDITQEISIPDHPTTSTGARARGRGSRNDVMRSRRNYIAELAARSTNVDYVDLVSSPLPCIQGVINVDLDPEDVNSTSKVGLNQNSEKRKSLDCSFEEENPEMSVKIKWNGGIPEIFKLRKYQKFSNIFNKLAERENTNAEFLVFNLNNRIISSEDTPASINYKIYQFIDGRVLLEKFNAPLKKRDANKISLKIQSDQWKRPLKVDLLKTDKFKILYIKCAEELNVSCENIKLSFDGDHLEYNATPIDFEFEGGEAIDLRIRK